MEIEFVEKIEQLRKQRKFSISQVTQGVVSDSAYSRFTKGKTSLSSDSFIQLLHNLEADFYEIANLDHNPRIVDDYKSKCMELLEAKDFEGLERLRKVVTYKSKFTFDTYHNIALIIEVETARHEDRPIDPTTYASIQDHLMQTETWAVLEAFLFGLIVESFESQYLIIMLENYVSKNRDYIYAERHSHIITILFTACMALLERQKLDLARVALEMMRPYMLAVGFTRHKFFFRLAELLVMVASDHSQANVSQLVGLHTMCVNLGNVSHSYRITSNYNKLRSIYELADVFGKE